MAVKYTEEQLNKFNKAALIQLFLTQQEQLLEIDKKLQLLLEQVAVLNHNRFGRSTEKLAMDDQIAFMEVDGKIVFFNEAEAVAALEDDGDDNDEPAKPRSHKAKGKREEDFKGLPVVSIEHKMTDEELSAEFGDHGWRQLPDEVYRRYRFTPAKVEVEEHHVGVYAAKKEDRIVRAKHPGYLLRNSPASPSLEAAILNAKYVNAVPLYRQEKEFERYGINITRKNMADWTIRCAERYLAILYDCLHEKLYGCHVIQADETPVLVNRDGRPAGSKSYMWVYRSGRMCRDTPIVLYDYQRTRNASHPREFLKGFKGVCVTDGYQVYHTLEKEREDLTIAGCWAHARRRFDEAVKALPRSSQKSSLAYLALKQIQAIYREDSKLDGLAAQERTEQRQLTVRPLVEAYFAWIRENAAVCPKRERPAKGSATR